MISYNVYKLIHLVSIFGLFISLACAVVLEKAQSRWTAPAHGVSLVFILIGGFGMLARLGIHGSLPGWVIGKLVIWLIFGACIALAKRKVLPLGAFLFLITALGGVAASLALWKP
jgi:hypothetical protein